MSVKLTFRQEEVLALVELGKSNSEIAKDLDITVSTVKNHLARMFDLTGASNRTELVYLSKQ